MPVERRNLATSLLSGGSLLAILGQITQVALPFGQRAGAVILMAIGIAIYFFGVLTAKSETASTRIEQALLIPGRWLGLQTWQFASLTVALLLSALAHYAAGDMDLMVSPIAGWLAWILAIGFGLAGSWSKGGFDFRAHRNTFAIALGFVIIALPFRILSTNSIPIILNGDEASAGLYALSVLKGTANNPFMAGWYSFPSLYFLIPAAGISLLGQTTAALRVPSAIAGALTVGGVYLSGRAMFDKRTAAIAAIAMVGFHFHIHFSRIGLNNIWDGLFFAITTGAAWYAWEKENRNAYILTGLGLGFSQYFYPSSRVLTGLVIGLIIASGVFDFKKLKRSLPNIVLMSIITTVILLPLAWYYIRYPSQFFAPMDRVSILGDWLVNEQKIRSLPAWKILLRQLWLGAESFTFLPLQHWYMSETAFLRPLYAGFFLLGLANIVARFKESRSLLFLGWFVLYILLGGLSESTPAAQRYSAAAPLGMLLFAHGLNETAGIFENLWPSITRYATVFVLAFAITASIADAGFYFNTYTPKTAIQFDHNNGAVAQAVANELRTKPKGTQVLFFGNPDMWFDSIPSIPYLAPQVEGLNMFQPWGALENPVPTSGHLIFIFLPLSSQDKQIIMDTFPNGTLLEFPGVDGRPLYWSYEYHNQSQ
ncbi:MAG TPA: glycosyltransferase family 39 protein [Anaerolineales bacterium]|nr:glycosyltransferase family 39 protein [Anaerolineales bacterium]